MDQGEEERDGNGVIDGWDIKRSGISGSGTFLYPNPILALSLDLNSHGISPVRDLIRLAMSERLTLDEGIMCSLAHTRLPESVGPP